MTVPVPPPPAAPRRRAEARVPAGLFVLGATALFVVALGTWGWVADEEPAIEQHHQRVQASHVEAFCRDLGHALGPFVGRVMEKGLVSPPPEPPSDQALLDAAAAMRYWDANVGLQAEAPGPFRTSLRRLVAASAVATTRQSTAPLRQPATTRAIATLETLWDAGCT